MENGVTVVSFEFSGAPRKESEKTPPCPAPVSFETWAAGYRSSGLLEFLQDAIEQDSFSSSLLKQLDRAISMKLGG